MKILIVDDELSSREHVKRLLSEFFPEVTICGEAENISAAFETITLHQPDVVLLDVDLMDGTAFDLLKRFQQIKFNIILLLLLNNMQLRQLSLVHSTIY